MFQGYVGKFLESGENFETWDFFSLGLWTVELGFFSGELCLNSSKTPDFSKKGYVHQR